MLLTCAGFSATYEIESLARMLFPSLTRTPRDGDTEELLARMDEVSPDETRLSIRLRMAGHETFREKTVRGLSEKERVLPLALLLYDVVRACTGRSLRWGILTGIRPIKLFHSALAQGQSDREIAEQMRVRYAMSDEMIALALHVARAEQRVHLKSDPRGFSLYVSIPFCPQRCSYCSFVSQDIGRQGHLIPRYVELLCEELRQIGKLAERLGLRLQTVYFGGGTPTTLSAAQLQQLFGTIEGAFDRSGLLEYTVEAGRPDTIDQPRLEALRAAGVTRISVNPQSMDDRVLAAVGRNHTVADVERAYALARSLGFDGINMDLIAGLPSDTPRGFARSVERVLALRPENITVHTLTLKRASDLAIGIHDEEALLSRGDAVAEMIDGARARISATAYEPYYLYRQKNSIASLDNTGYTRPGREGIYNVFMMDETQSVLAAGAGGVTRLREPGGEKIERIFNYKLPPEYIERFDQLLQRKERVVQFYENMEQK